MKYILFLFLLFCFDNSYSQDSLAIAKRDSARRAWAELMRKCEIEDSLRDLAQRRPFIDAFDKQKNKFIGHTYYTKIASKKYKVNTPFKCVDMVLDKKNNITMFLVNGSDTLSIDGYMDDYNFKISISESFNKIFYTSSNKKKSVDYKSTVNALYIGMSKKSVLYLMGKPTSIKTTISAMGEYEFWVYPNDIYISFLNDKVTVIQK